MKISHIKGNPSVTTKWLLFKGFMTNLQVLSLGAQRSPADLRLHLNKWFKHYSRTFNPFVTMSWDQSLTVSSHLIGWLQLSAPLEEKRAWTSELNEHVGIQWILICLYFPKSSGEKKRRGGNLLERKLKRGPFSCCLISCTRSKRGWKAISSPAMIVNERYECPGWIAFQEWKFCIGKDYVKQSIPKIKVARRLSKRSVRRNPPRSPIF